MIRTLSAGREEAHAILGDAGPNALGARGLIVVDAKLIGACSRFNFHSCVLVPARMPRGKWMAVEQDAYARRGEAPPEALFVGSLDEAIAWANRQDAGVREVERVSADRRNP